MRPDGASTARRSIRAAPLAWVPIALLVLYVAIVVVTAMHHEPWRDEADPWLMVRDRSLVGVLRLTNYAGTPSLWFLMLFPMAKLGLPFASQEVLHVSLAISVAALVLFRSPFTLPTRALLVFSHLLVFEYAVVARSYVLTVLLLFVVADGYARRRSSWHFGIGLALLANTNVPGMFLAGSILGAELLKRFLDRRTEERPTLRDLAPLAIAIAGVVLAVLQVVPPKHGQKRGMSTLWNPENVAEGFGGGFMPFGPLWWQLAVALLVLGSSWFVLRRARAPLIAFVAYCGLMAFLFTQHAGHTRHFGLLLVGLVGLRWAALRDRGETEADLLLPHDRRRWAAWAHVLLLGGSLLAWCERGAQSVTDEVTMRFSNGPAMGAYLRDSGLSKRKIAAHHAENASSVLPELPGVRLWYAGISSYGTHMKWDRRLIKGRKITHDDVVRRVKRRFPQWNDPKDGVLLLLSRELLNAETHGYRLLHAESEPVFMPHAERLWLYAPIGFVANTPRGAGE